MKAFLLQTVSPIGAMALVLIGIFQLGHVSEQELKQRLRDKNTFADLQYVPPGPKQRETILCEAQEHRPSAQANEVLLPGTAELPIPPIEREQPFQLIGSGKRTPPTDTTRLGERE